MPELVCGLEAEPNAKIKLLKAEIERLKTEVEWLTAYIHVLDKRKGRMAVEIARLMVALDS